MLDQIANNPYMQNNMQTKMVAPKPQQQQSILLIGQKLEHSRLYYALLPPKVLDSQMPLATVEL